MNDDFRCPDCGVRHADPAEATLGIDVLCWDCHAAAQAETLAPGLRPAA